MAPEKRKREEEPTPPAKKTPPAEEEPPIIFEPFIADHAERFMALMKGCCLKRDLRFVNGVFTSTSSASTVMKTAKKPTPRKNPGKREQELDRAISLSKKIDWGPSKTPENTKQLFYTGGFFKPTTQ